MKNTAIKRISFLSGLLPVLFLMCGCADELDIAAKQAKGGAYRIAIESYKAYLAKHPGNKRRAAELNYEIGVLLVKDNKKEESLFSFKKAAEAGYPADKLRTALRELVGELQSVNLPATKKVLEQLRGVNEDFTEYADIQLLRLQNLEAEATRLVAEAAENIALAQFDQAREKLGRARTIVPGVAVPGLADFQKDLPSLEANYAYEQDLKGAFHVFDKTRRYEPGPRFDSAAYNKFKKLEQLDAEMQKEIESAILYKALGGTARERRENETTPGLRYKDFLYRKYGLKFTVKLPEYDQARRGCDITAQYETPPCNALKLKFPVIEIGESRAAALSSAKTTVLVEIAVSIVPVNISRKLGKEIIAPGCEILSGRASLDGKTVFIKKP